MYDEFIPTFRDILNQALETGKPLVYLPYNDKLAKESIQFLKNNGYALDGHPNLKQASCELTPSGFDFLQKVLNDKN